MYRFFAMGNSIHCLISNILSFSYSCGLKTRRKKAATVLVDLGPALMIVKQSFSVKMIPSVMSKKYFSHNCISAFCGYNFLHNSITSGYRRKAVSANSNGIEKSKSQGELQTKRQYKNARLIKASSDGFEFPPIWRS